MADRGRWFGMRLWPAFIRAVIVVTGLLMLFGLSLLVESGWHASRHHARTNALSDLIADVAIVDQVGSLDAITEQAVALGAVVARTDDSVTYRRVRGPGWLQRGLSFTDHRLRLRQGRVLAKEVGRGRRHVTFCFGPHEHSYWPLVVRCHWLAMIGLGGIALWSLRGAFAATPPPRPPLRHRAS